MATVFAVSSTGRLGESMGERPELHLRLYPDTVLRTRCAPIDRFDTWLTDVLDEMLALMRAAGGIGLAGPQAGIPQRLIVAEIGHQTICLVNPVIAAWCGADRMTEGCLSLPGLSLDIERNRQLEVRGYDAFGRRQRHRVEGLWARVMQHEIDHLDGILVCDHQGRIG
jgi:peptide deformylase